MIKMVVFDMAGTTVDEDNVVYKTLQKVINNAGYHFTLDEVLQHGAGKEKHKAITDILAQNGGSANEAFTQQLYAAFVPALAAAYDSFQLKPQPGAEDVFKSLREKNILVVLNTGYNGATANSILQKLGWQAGNQVDALITASDVEANRPSPDMILLAMKKFGIIDPAEVAKVGDSAIDIEEGKNAGCILNVGITTGAHTVEQLKSANPKYIIHHLTELLRLV